MSRRSIFSLLLFLACACFLNLAAAQFSAAAPSGPLTCHKDVCAQPTSSCQVLESQSCIHGGGPPHCPAIVNAADGTSCSDGNSCTTADVCSSGVCGGTPIVCSSPTDTCSLTSGCATRCDSTGCTVAAAGGYLNPTLTVPPGALASPVNISMVDQGGDPNDSSVFHVYSFAPNGTTFSPPATVDLPAPPLSAGQVALIEVSDDSVAWTAIATTVNGARVSGPIAHFSKCRTRAAVQGPGGGSLDIVDMVGYQEAIVSLIPPIISLNPTTREPGSCRVGLNPDIFGLCFKMKNPDKIVTDPNFTSNCPDPLPAVAPPGCHLLHVIPWQCSLANRTLPPFDPANPTAYEGQHCDRAGGFLIPCPETIYTMDQFLPAGGLPSGQELWVDLNFFVNPPPPANGAQPYACIASSGFFIGFDVLFREPSGNDSLAGIRSAKLGPFIDVPMGTKVFLPPGVGGCSPTPPATNCPVICNSTTCQVEWEWLVSKPANYPTLRCERPGTPNALISCSQYQTGDIADKNWFIDSAF